MAKVFPPIAPTGIWVNLVVAVMFLIAPKSKAYVRDLEQFREAHRFD